MSVYDGLRFSEIIRQYRIVRLGNHRNEIMKVLYFRYAPDAIPALHKLHFKNEFLTNIRLINAYACTCRSRLPIRCDIINVAELYRLESDPREHHIKAHRILRLRRCPTVFPFAMFNVILHFRTQRQCQGRLEHLHETIHSRLGVSGHRTIRINHGLNQCFRRVAQQSI